MDQIQLMNGRYLALFPSTAQGRRDAELLRRVDVRMKHARIKTVLQLQPSEVHLGVIYDRYTGREAVGDGA